MKENWLNKKLILIITFVLFVGVMIALVFPLMPGAAAYRATLNQSTFDVTFDMGNNNCSIIEANILDITASPTESTTTTVYLIYNVSDDNGWADVNSASSYANATKGAVTHQSTGCTSAATSNPLIAKVNCTITMNFYDVPGSDWTISVSSTDGAGVYKCSNSSASSLTYNALYAMTIDKDLMAFVGNPGQKVVSSSNPLTISNTANGNYASFDLTAYDLSKTTNRAVLLGSANFSMTTDVYATNRTMGTNATAVKVPGAGAGTNASLARGTSGASTLAVNMSLSVPNGLETGSYNTTNRWVIDAIA